MLPIGPDPFWMGPCYQSENHGRGVTKADVHGHGVLGAHRLVTLDCTHTSHGPGERSSTNLAGTERVRSRGLLYDQRWWYSSRQPDGPGVARDTASNPTDHVQTTVWESGSRLWLSKCHLRSLTRPGQCIRRHLREWAARFVRESEEEDQINPRSWSGRYEAVGLGLIQMPARLARSAHCR
jgi:hypothetical protein